MPRLFAIRLKAQASSANPHPWCIHCGQPATKEAMFQEDGAIVIEKYCDVCIRWENLEKILQENERVAELTNRHYRVMIG